MLKEDGENTGEAVGVTDIFYFYGYMYSDFQGL